MTINGIPGTAQRKSKLKFNKFMMTSYYSTLAGEDFSSDLVISTNEGILISVTLLGDSLAGLRTY